MGQPVTLIQALLNPRVYPHPVEDLELRETPYSWIILTGHYAYKIKKPVAYAHLDYSTLTKRRYYCYAELRLNQHLAPELYFDVSTITGSVEAPQMNGHGPILEFAVKMRQVADVDRLSQRLTDNRLSAADFDRLGETIARLHRDIDSAPFDTPFGHPDAVRLPLLKNLNLLRKTAASRELRTRLESLERWCIQQHQNLSSIMLQRKRAGYVRECHGNLQLDKIIVHENTLVPMDSVEYNDNLRWIDVIGEIACPMADLVDRGHIDHAYRLLNAYLQQTGDYPGLGLLPYYLVGRALTRAAFAALRHLEADSTAERDEAHYELLRHLATAEQLTLQPRPALIILYGLPGSDKSMLALCLLAMLHGICIRSDIERKRLFGLTGPVCDDASIESGMFTLDASRHTYERLENLAATALDAGYPVIVNATFIKQARRQQFQNLAERLHVPFLIVHCTMPKKTASTHDGETVIDADSSILQRMEASEEPLSDEEKSVSLTVSPANRHDLPQACARINASLDKAFALQTPREGYGTAGRN